jgi:hypothetical protein
MSAIGKGSKVRCVKRESWYFILNGAPTGAAIDGPKLGEICTIQHIHIDSDGHFFVLDEWPSIFWRAEFFVPIDDLKAARSRLTIVSKTRELENA